jgi:hypothetical protein
MVIHDGATQVTERVVNPDGDYLKQLPAHIRSYEDAVKYAPNQAYIGNLNNEELKAVPFPWYENPTDITERTGKYGEIMPEDEYYGLMQICDTFDLVELEAGFAAAVKEKLAAHGMFTDEQVAVLDKNANFTEESLAAVVADGGCGLYFNDKLVGVVKKAHDVDVNLSAHVMLENISSKATSVLSLLHLVRATGIDPAEVDYVIDCAEEACGDMNQRGGGNFAKAAAEIAGFVNATGSDTRGFCAGPAHALLNAASLVKAGTFKNVVVTAGGCTAKLGMNGKSHVDKGLPILEDCLAGFSVLISEDNGTDPVIRTDIVGRHTVGTGSSPQAVISSLVTDPLDAAGLKITDVCKFAPEMQNPDITKPAGAGDVPEANYKMIAALGVKRGDIEKKELASFIVEHGMKGWAPTQGHIPSGVPFMGPCRDMMLAGDIKRAMVIGKGSLFLGRMTNLFDGVSFVIEANNGQSAGGSGVSEEEVRGLIANALKDFAAGLLAE